MPPKKSKPTISKSDAVWFVTGSDEAAVKKAASTLAAKLSPGDDPFATEVIDGAAQTVDEALRRLADTHQALLTLPMFGGEKLVWLKSATCFSDTPVGRSEAVASQLEKLLTVIAEGLPEGIRLIVSAPEPDKRRGTYKTLSGIAKTTICDKPDFGFGGTEADVVDWVSKKAAERGVLFDEEALEILAARIGADTAQVDTELEKLILAADGQTVDADLVRNLVPLTRQGGIFDLSNMIIRKNLPGALLTLRQLLGQKESGMTLLLAAIYPSIRNLLLVQDIMVRNKITPPAKAFFFGKTLEGLPANETAHLPRKKDGGINSYPLGLAAAGARKFDQRTLSSAMAGCRKANLELVSSSLDEEVILGKLLIELLG